MSDIEMSDDDKTNDMEMTPVPTKEEPREINPANLPWVEKYRPAHLSDLISHTDIIQTLNRFIEQDRFPHLLLYGPPGTGKTSTILACARKLYSEQQYASSVLELNASDDRGINVVRGVVLNFANSKGIVDSNTFKLIILDEADAMTNDAQNALRRIIEKFTENTRFCLICNYLSKIIPALQSRCTRFRFGPLTPSQIMPRLDFVIKKEGVKANDAGKKALIELAEGDMRRVLNVLQSTHLAFGEVTEENVYQCCGQHLKSDMQTIGRWLIQKDVSENFKNITALQAEKGLALQDMLTRLLPFVHKMKFSSSTRAKILVQMANIENQIASGGSEKLQLGALIGAFYVAACSKKR